MEKKRPMKEKYFIVKIRGIHIWWNVLPLVGLVLWGALGITNNLWYDEAYSAALISHSFSDMVQITAVDAHSPFYYSLLKIFYHLLGGGTNFWSLKLLSVLFMMGYLLLGKFYVKKLFGEKTAVYFMLFSMLMPAMAVQAANARMYAAALFFLTLTGLVAYDIYREATVRKWIIFCLAGICSVYCHTYSMIQTVFLYLFLFCAIWYQKEYRKWKGLLASGFVTAAAYLPWLVVTYRQMGARIEQGSQIGVPTVYSFMDYCMEWFSALETPIVPVVYAGMAVTVFLGYYAVNWMRKSKNCVPGLGFAMIGLTTIVGVLVSLYLAPTFLGRYVFPGFGALALLYAVGFDQINSRIIRTGVLTVMAGCFLLQYKSELTLEYDNGLKVYEEFYAENVMDQDCIMGPSIHSIMLSVYHPELQYFLYGHKPEFTPFQNTEAFKLWEQLEEREGNIWYICFRRDSSDLLGERYNYEEVLSFQYMYYDFVVYKLTHK